MGLLRILLILKENRTERTDMSDFPTKNPIQGSYGGGSRDFYIAKLYFNPYSTPGLIIAAGSGGTTDPSPGTDT